VNTMDKALRDYGLRCLGRYLRDELNAEPEMELMDLGDQLAVAVEKDDRRHCIRVNKDDLDKHGDRWPQHIVKMLRERLKKTSLCHKCGSQIKFAIFPQDDGGYKLAMDPHECE